MTPIAPPPDIETAPIEHLDFATEPDCDVLGPQGHAAAWWVVCRSCRHHYAACDSHLDRSRELAAKRMLTICTRCGRSYPSFDWGFHVEPIRPA